MTTKHSLSEKSKIRKLCNDLGFGGLKGAEVNGKDLLTYQLPAQVGLMRKTDQISLGGVANPGGISTDRPLQVGMTDGATYLVGNNIAAYTTPIPQMDFTRFSDSIELRANLYGLFSLIFNPGKHDTSILLTLPVEPLKTEESANRVERGIKSWLVGEHQFSVDNQSYAVNVHRVRCKMPQPVAIWCDWGFTLEGTWYRGPDALIAPYMIIDPGFNTLDLVIVQNRKILTRLSGGEKLGMRIAAQRLSQLLRDKYGLELDVYQADLLIKKLVIQGRGVTTYVGGDSIDITPLARQALDSLKADSLIFIEDSIKNAAASKNILGGGGAIALGSLLRQQLKGNLEVLEDPVLAGARGGSKIANRKGFLD